MPGHGPLGIGKERGEAADREGPPNVPVAPRVSTTRQGAVPTKTDGDVTSFKRWSLPAAENPAESAGEVQLETVAPSWPCAGEAIHPAASNTSKTVRDAFIPPPCARAPPGGPRRDPRAGSTATHSVLDVERERAVLAAGVRDGERRCLPGDAAPDDHPRAGPNRGVKTALRRPSRRGRRGPGIGTGIVLTAAVEVHAELLAAPHDHPGTGPDGGGN